MSLTTGILSFSAGDVNFHVYYFIFLAIVAHKLWSVSAPRVGANADLDVLDARLDEVHRPVAVGVDRRGGDDDEPLVVPGAAADEARGLEVRPGA